MKKLTELQAEIAREKEEQEARALAEEAAREQRVWQHVRDNCESLLDSAFSDFDERVKVALRTGDKFVTVTIAEAAGEQYRWLAEQGLARCKNAGYRARLNLRIKSVKVSDEHNAYNTYVTELTVELP